MKAIIVGDSHIGALKRGWDSAPERFPEMSFIPFGSGTVTPTKFFNYDKTAGKVAIVAERWAKLTFERASQDPDSADTVWIVSLPLNTNRILRDYSWHSHVPWNLHTSPSEIALSDAVMRRIIEQDSAQSIAFLKALRTLGLNVTAIEGPRHFAHARFLKVARQDVCMAVENLFREQVSEALRDAGIPIIMQPENTIDADGRTSSKFKHENSKDLNHAGTEYGVLALKSIDAYVASVRVRN